MLFLHLALLFSTQVTYGSYSWGLGGTARSKAWRKQLGIMDARTCIFSGASHKVKVSSSSFSSELSYSLLTNLQLVKHATPSLLSKQHHGADHEHQVQYPLGMHLTYMHSGISKLHLECSSYSLCLHAQYNIS